MNKTHRRRWCFALGISITFVIVGFLGFVVRAFATAGASGFFVYAGLGILITAIFVYFTLQRTVGDAAMKLRSFADSVQKP